MALVTGSGTFKYPNILIMNCIACSKFGGMIHLDSALRKNLHKRTRNSLPSLSLTNSDLTRSTSGATHEKAEDIGAEPKLLAPHRR